MDDFDIPTLARKHSYLMANATGPTNPKRISPLVIERDSTDDEVVAVEKIRHDKEYSSESSEETFYEEVPLRRKKGSSENDDNAPGTSPPKTEYITTSMDKVQSPTLKRLVKMFSEPKEGLEGALLTSESAPQHGYVLQKMIVRGHNTFGSESPDYALPSRWTHSQRQVQEPGRHTEGDKASEKKSGPPQYSEMVYGHPYKKKESEPCLQKIYKASEEIDERRKSDGSQSARPGLPPIQPKPVTDVIRPPEARDSRKNSLEEYVNPDQLLHQLQKASVKSSIQKHSGPPKSSKSKESNQLPLPCRSQTPEERNSGNESDMDDSDLEDEIDHLKDLLKQDEKRLEEETEWGKEAIRQIMQLNEMRIGLQREIDSGGGSVQSKSIKNKLEEAEYELKNMTSKYQQIQNEFHQRQEELAYSEGYVDKLKEKILDAERDSIIASKEVDQKQDQRTTLKVELQEAMHTLNQLQQNKDHLNSKIRSLSDDIKELTTTNEDLESRIEKEHFSMDSAEQTQRRASEELQLKNNLVTARETELHQLTRVFAKAEDSYDDYKKRIKQLNETVRTLSYKNADLDVSVKKERAALQKEQMTTAHKKEELAKVSNQMESLKHEQTMMISNLGEAKKTSEELRSQLGDQEGIVQKLTHGMVASQQKLDIQTQQIDVLREQMEELMAEKAFVMEEFERMNGNLQEKSQVTQDLQKAYERKIESMKNVVDLQKNGREQIGKTFTNDLQLAREEIGKLKETMNQKEAQLNMYGNAIRELREIFKYSFMKSSSLE